MPGFGGGMPGGTSNNTNTTSNANTNNDNTHDHHSNNDTTNNGNDNNARLAGRESIYFFRTPNLPTKVIPPKISLLKNPGASLWT